MQLFSRRSARKSRINAMIAGNALCSRKYHSHSITILQSNLYPNSLLHRYENRTKIALYWTAKKLYILEFPNVLCPNPSTSFRNPRLFLRLQNNRKQFTTCTHHCCFHWLYQTIISDWNSTNLHQQRCCHLVNVTDLILHLYNV